MRIKCLKKQPKLIAVRVVLGLVYEFQVTPTMSRQATAYKLLSADRQCILGSLKVYLGKGAIQRYFI